LIAQRGLWKTDAKLLAHYKLDDDLPTKTVIDFIGLNDGESHRNTEDMHVAGKIGGAFNMNGSTDEVDIGNVPSLCPVKDGLPRYANNPVLDTDHDAFASVFKDGDTYYAWSGGQTTLYRHTSSDGKSWGARTICTGLTLASVPSVWKEGATWHMIYRKDGGAKTVINYATSNDGLAWSDQGTKVTQGGVGEWDYNVHLDPWGIIKDGSTYYLWYNTTGGAARKTGIATTTNLAGAWTKDANNPIFTGGRFCVWPFKHGHHFYLAVCHYTSGVTPDLHSEIELFRDTSPTFYPESREFVRNLLNPATTGLWDGEALDTPCVLTDDIFRNSYAASAGEFWMYYSGMDNMIDKINKTGLVIEPNFLTAIEPHSFGVTFWMKHGTVMTRTILSFGVTGVKYALRIMTRAGDYGTGNLSFGSNQGNVQTIRPEGEDWNDNQWHFVAITWEGVDETTAKIYVDGVLEETIKIGTFTIGVSDEALLLGGNEKDDVPESYFPGILDEVKLYDGILTLERINHLMKV